MVHNQIVQCSIERCVSVLQPSLGVSSRDLGRSSERPLFWPRHEGVELRRGLLMRTLSVCWLPALLKAEAAQA
jgi:hypothetical protein